MLMKWSDLEVGDKIELTKEMRKYCSLWSEIRTGVLIITEIRIISKGVGITFKTRNNVIGIVDINEKGEYSPGIRAFELIELAEDK